MTTPERASVPKVQNFEKFDGSVWQQIETMESVILLTGAGRELLADQSVESTLLHYVDDLRNNREGPDDTRRFLAEGANARVFSVGDERLVVKESKHDPDADQLLPAINRMDELLHAVENHCPRWIDIPKHYGVMLLKSNPSRQYMLIEKIDDGISVGDVLRTGTPRVGLTYYTVEDIYGELSKKDLTDIADRYERLKSLLRHALMAEYLHPDTYLPDIDTNPHNVLLERASTPVAGSRYKFWVIDQ